MTSILCFVLGFAFIDAFVVQNTHAASTAQSPDQFLATTIIDVGRSPRVLLHADFTGDHIPDLVTHRWGQASVIVLPGNGNGEFLPGKVSTLATDVLSIAAGDLNRDGFLDIVTTDRERNTVGIALNDGTGSFRQIQTLYGVQGPYGVALADVNGDATTDVIAANFYGASISVFLGAQSLQFKSPVTYAVGSNPFDVTVGDLNADRQLDIVVANSGTNSISIVQGNGDGTFNASVNYPVGSNPRQVAVGDLDNDDDLDLVTSNNGANTLTLLRNNGAGKFEKSATIVGRAGINHTAIRDMNRDGLADLLVANGNDNSVSVLLANGDRTYQPGQQYPVGGNPTWLVVADLNADGLLDVATPNFNSGSVSVLLAVAPPPATATPSPTKTSTPSPTPSSTPTPSPTRTPAPTTTPQPQGEPPAIDRFEINGGALATGSQNVSLALEASDPDTGTASLQMRFSNDGREWADWQTFRQTTAWKLSAGESEKTVYAQVRDDQKNNSTVATDTIRLDSRAGDSYTLTINKGARYTNNTSVELTITAKPGTALMQVSSDGSFNGAIWEPYTSRKAWQVERYKTNVITRIVYVRFKTSGEVSLPISDDILFDGTPPWCSQIIAKAVSNGGGEYELMIQASDLESGLADMRLSTNSSLDDVAWEEFNPTRLWQGGSSRVYIQLRDAAGNTSAVLSAQIGAQTTYVPIAQR